MEQERRKNYKYVITIIILIIIILLLSFYAKFGFIQNENMLIPTGNIDVFDIYINCECNNKDNCPIIPVYNEDEEDEDEEKMGKLYIYDDNGDFVYQNRLKIFENAAYQYTNKIAPGISNTYNFVVHNSNKFKIKYAVEMQEEKDYGVNLKYRLRKNNKYVVGNENTWVTANELKTYLEYINGGISDSYSLDWNWPYEGGVDEKDTYAGKNMIEEYKLNVKVYIEQGE